MAAKNEPERSLRNAGVSGFQSGSRNAGRGKAQQLKQRRVVHPLRHVVEVYRVELEALPQHLLDAGSAPGPNSSRTTGS